MSIRKLSGLGISEGIVMGKAHVLQREKNQISKNLIIDLEKELSSFWNAIACTKEELNQLIEKSRHELRDEAALIFEAHLEILEDEILLDPTIEMIRDMNCNADYALFIIREEIVQQFEKIDNEYLRTRADDIRDVTDKVIRYIQGKTNGGLDIVSDNTILFVDELTPSDTIRLDLNKIVGIVTETGSYTSHSAILARNLGIPAITGVSFLSESIISSHTVLLDGTRGELYLEPDDNEKEEYFVKKMRIEEESNESGRFLYTETKTLDGHKLLLAANIGGLEDAYSALQCGTEGIGLFRTEFLFMNEKDMPDEEKQFIVYKNVLETMSNQAVVIRTLDIGGDKNLPYLDMKPEENPFLGNRALRLCLQNPDIFRIQLRALLRASAFGNLHIMFPMVSTVEEVRAAKKILHQVNEELLKEGIKVADRYFVGIMIEVPAAALNAEHLAKEVDFFSIGSNDLIQYTFAADRMNTDVSYLYQPLHPSILKLIKMVVDAAHNANIWVGVCGEMAADSMVQKALIGLGIDELSMSPNKILSSRAKISKMNFDDLKQLAEQAMFLATEEEIKLLFE